MAETIENQQTEFSVTIPVNDLKALNLFSAKKDVRYFLNGLHIDGRYITATNGHVLMRIKHYWPAEQSFVLDSGVIVSNPILMTSRKLPNAILNFSNDCTLLKENWVQSVELIHGDNQNSQKLEIIDGQYPNIERVIPKVGDLETSNAVIQGQYFELIGKTAKLLDPKTKAVGCRIVGNKNEAQLVKINGRDDVEIVVMPMKS